MPSSLVMILALAFAAPAEPQELSVRITAPDAAIHVGDYPKFAVSISNSGKQPVSLVQPGDGSESKWRTPVIGWSVLPTADASQKHPTEPPLFRGARCGNTNPLKRAEIFSLVSEKSQSIGEWAGSPAFSKPGKYRVVFYYQNIPTLKGKGLSLGGHEAGAIELIQKSHPCLLVSNEVIVDVLPKNK